MEHFYEQVDGYFWFQNAYERLLDTLPTDRVSQFIELGVYRGRSLAWLGVEAVNRRLRVQIVGIDLFPSGLLEQVRDTLTPLGSTVKLMRADSAQAASKWPDHSVDVVWIDADHSREACLRDIDAWWPKLKVGGWMGGDDYAHPDVAEAVGQRFPVHEVVNGHAADGGPWPWWLATQKGTT